MNTLPHSAYSNKVPVRLAPFRDFKDASRFYWLCYIANLMVLWVLYQVNYSALCYALRMRPLAMNTRKGEKVYVCPEMDFACREGRSAVPSQVWSLVTVELPELFWSVLGSLQ